MRRSFERAPRAIIVVGVAIGLIAVAGPAVAAVQTVETAGWEWLEIHDTTLGISDATAYHRDVLGSGADLKGWTEDAFDAYESVDGYLSGIGVDHADPGLSAALFPVPVSFDVLPGGGAVVVSEVADHDLGGGILLDVVITLEVRGSFARWTIEIDDSGSGLVESVWGSGELGSPTAASNVGPDGLVVTGPPGLGPVIGLQLESDGTSDTIDGSDPEFPSFTAVGASTIVFTLALLEYDPCAEDAAVAHMTTLIPDFATSFGEDLDPVFSSCVSVEAPAPMQFGVPTDQILALTLADELAGGHPRLDGETYFEYIDLWTSGLGVLAPDLPAGLSLEVVEHPVTLTPALRLSGTPVEAMSGEVPLRLYGIRDSPDFDGEMPIAATLRVRVDSLDLAGPVPGGGSPEELAASGADLLPGLLASLAAIVVGLALLRGDRRPVTRHDPREAGRGRA